MRLLPLAILGAALPLLAACVSSKPLTLPDGSQGFAVKCDGHFHDMADCMAEAGRMCPTGYDVLDGATESTPFAMSNGYASGNAYGAHAGSTSYAGTMVFRNMMVRCHGPKAP